MTMRSCSLLIIALLGLVGCADAHPDMLLPVKDIPNGWVTLVSPLITALAVYIGYRMSQRTRRVRLANALAIEIKCVFETHNFQLCDSEKECRVKALGSEAFLVWYGRSGYPIFDAAGADLWLLPSDTVASLVRFYERDSLLRGGVMALAEANFLSLPSEKRIAHVEYLFKELHGSYRAAKDEAIERLAHSTSAPRKTF
ncbi:MAG: hypothetical protein J0H19_00075 [Rhodospirillales bacterium]|nr:hypothetical protein [Rhodospirillales bacterium]MBN8924999.1 hypothetical protein [Rhodospirillales bacterium]